MNPLAITPVAINNAQPLATDPLAQLRDIHLPPPIGWWPPAPGWWLLAATSITIVVAIVYFSVRRYRQRRYRHAALREVQALYAQWQTYGDDLAFLQALNRLLKQTALAAFSHQTIVRRQIAALNGTEWLSFLDSRVPKPQFTEPNARVLAQTYQPQPEAVQPQILVRAAEYWIRRHR